MLRVGTAGWQYRDWAGIVYPKPKPRGFDELTFLAGFFNVIEINSSFYGPPRPEAAKGWCERVSASKDFRFTAKLWQEFTHTRKAAAKEEKEFKRGIEPMAKAGRLGGILVQFPWSFRNEAENRAYLRRLVRHFREYPLVVEVRHGGWIWPDTLDEFAELGVGLCNIDQPLFKRSVEPAALTTSTVGYVRLHGRNYQQWFSKTANVRERYDYLYSIEELEPWVDRIREVEKDTHDTYVVANNHNVGKAVVNAFELQAFLTPRRVEPPESLIAQYPELEAIDSAARR